MTAFDSVVKLKKEGKSEGEIIALLRNQGTSPMEISDALNQSKIKEAVYDSDPTQGMTPSIMQTDEEEQNQNYSQNQYEEVPKNNEQYSSPQGQYSPPQEQYYPQYPQNNYYQEQNNYPPQEYDSEDQYYDGTQTPTDTIIEVAEQVFAEKNKKISKELKELTGFKNLFETKVDNLSHRLERMEKQFDKMQLSILEKVGEYGKGLEYLKKELNMVEDSMSKISKK